MSLPPATLTMDQMNRLATEEVMQARACLKSLVVFARCFVPAFVIAVLDAMYCNFQWCYSDMSNTASGMVLEYWAKLEKG